MGRNTNQVLLAIIIDLLCLVAAVFLAAWLRLALPWGRFLPEVTQELTLLVEALLIYPVIFVLLSLYDPDRRMHEWEEFLALVTASLLGALALAGLIYFTIREISRLLLIYFYIIYFVLLISWRPWFYWLVRRRPAVGKRQRRLLLVGGGEAARQAAHRLLELALSDVSLVGYLDESGESRASMPDWLPCLGSWEQAEQVVQHNAIDDVLIVLPASAYALAGRLAASLTETACTIWIIPDYLNLLIYGGQVQNLDGLLMISLKAPTLTGYQRMLKRSFDVFVTILLLLVFSPWMLIIAVLIRFDSPGPVVLKQQRVGENRRLFLMYKYRSMVAGAEQMAPDALRIDENDIAQNKHPDDPRITRLGRFLRRTSLDELPQLWNVLKGEMSLVGPRPELPMWVAKYQPWQQKRFAVPQGMTGWWQVNGRSNRPMFLHTEDDLYYVQHFSLLLDLQILLKTVWVVLRGKGAY